MGHYPTCGLGRKDVVEMILEEDFQSSCNDHLRHVHISEGLRDPLEGKARLWMALEGIKQGGYLWFQHNKRAWVSEKIGLVSWFGEPNLYRHPSLRVRVGAGVGFSSVVYVCRGGQ